MYQLSDGVKLCVHCEEIVENNEKICPNCGSFFLSKKCPRCKEIMKDNTKKCWNCGWDFNKNRKPKKKKDNIYEKYLKEIEYISFEKEKNQKKKKYIRLTHEQIEIIKNAQKNNIIINAFAGSGKSTTLLSIAYALKNKSFLFLAFNRSIKEEIEYKIKKANLNNIKVLTTHGLAYKFTKKDLNIQKLGKELNTSEISKILDINIFIADLIRIAFKDFCNGSYTNFSEDTIKDILEFNPKLKFIKDQHEYLKNKLMQLWDLYLDKLDITHNVYLKYFQMNIEKYSDYINFDYVLLDEAQDTNEVVLDIFKRLNGKKIIVGDPHQQIYSFRGSINAMYKIRNDFNAKVLYLTETFRFSKHIADKANKILEKFKSEDKKIISSELNNDNSIKNICFITRTNATLIKLIDHFKDKNISLVRSPKEIFNLPLNILYFKKYLDNKNYKDKDKDKVKEKWLLNFNSIDELSDYAENFEDYELISAINITEEYGEKIFDLYKKAEKKYENNKGKVFLTTAHTSKGLEWDKVVICHDFQNIVDLIKKEKFKNIKNFRKNYKDYIEKIITGEKMHFKHHYIIDEINLLYVAITRAKKELALYSNKNIFDIDINKKLEDM